MAALLVQAGLPPRSVAAQTTGPEARLAVAAELFLPEDTDNRDMRLASISVEVEKHLFGGLWLRGAAGPVFTEGVLLKDEEPVGTELEADGVGGGATGFLRWRPVRLAHIAPFVEVGFGVLLTAEDFPPGGTFWNFNQRYGLGLDLLISGRTSLVAAYRHVHVSNGKGLVPENPSYDGNGFMLAISW